VHLAHHRSAAASSDGVWDETDAAAANLRDAAASEVAVRGLMYANTHGQGSDADVGPAPPSKFQPVRGPSSHLPELATSWNAERLVSCLRSSSVVRVSAVAASSSALSAASALLPYLRVLVVSPGYSWLGAALPRSWSYVWQGAVVERAQGSAESVGVGRLTAAMEAAGLGESEEEAIEDVDE